MVEHKHISYLKRYWLTIAFLLGFLLDNVTLNRVDQVFDNVILFIYVNLAMISLLLLYAGTADKLPEVIGGYAKKYAPLLLQFSFGGLLSGMLIFYGRSGSWLESWPFLFVILVVILGNEIIKNRASRLIFNLSVLFIGLFSYVVLVIPVLTGKMGEWVFVGSGLLALMIMYGFVRLLYKIVPRFLTIHMRSIVFSIGIIFSAFNFLYFSNIIPPIPLSLKDVGIYHSIVRFDNGIYQMKYEKGAWYEFFKNSDTVFHAQDGDNIYCFAAVFAPTRLEVDVYHRWERYNEESKEWVDHGRYSYAIAGGRGDGFRGYTLIKNYSEGEWRCSVETGRGQVIGRVKFEIDSGEPRELVVREQ